MVGLVGMGRGFEVVILIIVSHQLHTVLSLLKKARKKNLSLPSNEEQGIYTSACPKSIPGKKQDNA